MKAIPITSTKDIIILRLRKQYVTFEGSILEKNYLTWADKSDKNYYIIEDNRYRENFEKEYFDIIECKIPLYLQEQLKEKQKQQGVEPNILPFIERVYASRNQGGFNWDESTKGEKYWHGVYDAFQYNIPLPIEQTFNFDIL